MLARALEPLQGSSPATGLTYCELDRTHELGLRLQYVAAGRGRRRHGAGADVLPARRPPLTRVPTDRDHTKTLLFERGGRRGDFTERDRLVLNVLQPDHTRLYRAAAARRRAYAALAVLEQVDEQTALVVLAVRDTIDVATARAPVLLRAYFFDDVQGRRCRGRSSSGYAGAAAGRCTFTVERLSVA
jgi:hypothetical protein